jgi:hypothetical protein
VKDQTAAKLLVNVMGWSDITEVGAILDPLMLLSAYKYDSYQRFGPGRRFIESLALWLDQFDSPDRPAALKLVTNRLVFFSDDELAHLVSTAYPDMIVQERARLVAEEMDIAAHRVRQISKHRRYEELRLKSLYLGLSDGARTNELRRASEGEIGNEQIWQAYELSGDKEKDMLDQLRGSLETGGFAHAAAKFNIVWLLDDFSGSGNTYIRYDAKNGKFKGKIKKIFAGLHSGGLVDTAHYEVFLLLYTATRQAIDHIEYWSERFTSENGYKPLQVKVLCPLEPAVSLKEERDPEIAQLLRKTQYYDARASDKHIAVGGTSDARMGFAECALPVVLSHNTPNNSIYMLWGPEAFKPFGLFPRMSRHREF